MIRSSDSIKLLRTSECNSPSKEHNLRDDKMPLFRSHDLTLPRVLSLPGEMLLYECYTAMLKIPAPICLSQAIVHVLVLGLYYSLIKNVILRNLTSNCGRIW